MTLHQLMTLTGRHRLATGSSQPPAQPAAPEGGGGFDFLTMAAMSGQM